jgi:hypothetical protein
VGLAIAVISMIANFWEKVSYFSLFLFFGFSSSSNSFIHSFIHSFIRVLARDTEEAEDMEERTRIEQKPIITRRNNCYPVKKKEENNDQEKNMAMMTMISPMGKEKEEEEKKEKKTWRDREAPEELN